MLRKFMGGLVALLLVATLLLPAASVGAQDDEIELSTAPVVTEETIPESEPPPVVEEPPIVAPQPDVPVVEQPVVEEPAVAEPVVEEPAAEELADDPDNPTVDSPAGSLEAENAGATGDEAVEGDIVETAADESDEVEAAGGTSISGVSLTCAGLLSFTIDETNGGPITIWLYTIDDVENPELGEEVIASPSTGATQVQFSIESASLTNSISASIVDDAYDLIGSTSVSGCAGDEGEEENGDEEPTAASVLTDVSVTCDGAVSFTITDAQPETLVIYLTDPNAPIPFNELANGSFDVTETGTFDVSFAIEARDSVRVDIYGGSDSVWDAQVNNCETDTEETEGGISNMTVDCAGAVAFVVDEQLEGGFLIVLYGATDGAFESIDSISLSPWFLEAGGHSGDFDVPADTYDRLRAEVTSSSAFLPFGIAEVSGCLDDGDPDPEPTETIVSNLRLFCNGLVRFDVATEVATTLDIVLTTIAPTPEFERNAQISAGSGAQQHQFFVPAAWYNDFSVSISEGGTLLNSVSIYGCLEGEFNTPAGDEVLTFTRYGSVIFDQVTESGNTNIGQYVDPNPPALPEGFSADDAQFFDLSTTSTHAGAIEVCLGLDQPFIDNSEGVRLLQYVGGAWVDVTSSVQPEQGQVCGVTTSLSTFAIARQAEDPDPDPDPDPTLPVVTNLTVDCTGLVGFDLLASIETTLFIQFLTPGIAPDFIENRELTVASGAHSVQFSPPIGQFPAYSAIVYGEDGAQIARARVEGCDELPPNTPSGSDVTVPVAGGTVTFDNVIEPGETYVTPLDPESAPPIPAEFEGDVVILVDISTTAVVSGAAEVCLPIVGEVAADAENVRLLHFENGSWVDITTFASAEEGVVCGVTSNFSPFAIVRLTDDDPGKPVPPGQPGGPDKPGHHGNPNWNHPQGGSASGSGSSATLTSLPNTGGGAPPATSGTETVQLLLCALALVAAAGLRVSTTRARVR